LSDHKSWINTLTLLPNGLLASGSYDGKIMIWNVSDSSPLFTLVGHKGWIRALTVINNEYLASSSFDKTIKLWSLSEEGPEEVNNWTASNNSIEALAFDPKLNVLVSAGFGNEVKVWVSRFWFSRLWENNSTRPGI
jgi:WD40 repeat protein